MKTERLASWTAGLVLALFLLCTAWEWRIAPLRSGGSWLVLKAAPLLAALPGLARARRYTFQWAALLMPAYLCEGIVRSLTEQGATRILAVLETLLAGASFACILIFARRTASRPRLQRGATPAD